MGQPGQPLLHYVLSIRSHSTQGNPTWCLSLLSPPPSMVHPAQREFLPQHHVLCMGLSFRKEASGRYSCEPWGSPAPSFWSLYAQPQIGPSFSSWEPLLVVLFSRFSGLSAAGILLSFLHCTCQAAHPTWVHSCCV